MWGEEEHREQHRRKEGGGRLKPTEVEGNRASVLLWWNWVDCRACTGPHSPVGRVALATPVPSLPASWKTVRETIDILLFPAIVKVIHPGSGPRPASQRQSQSGQAGLTYSLGTVAMVLWLKILAGTHKNVLTAVKIKRKNEHITSNVLIDTINILIFIPTLSKNIIFYCCFFWRKALT